jgi:uncharacterized membrane protein YfcA
MRIDLRVLRIWLAGAVFGAGASYLFSATPRAQYVFLVLALGWIVVMVLARLQARTAAPRGGRGGRR